MTPDSTGAARERGLSNGFGPQHAAWVANRDHRTILIYCVMREFRMSNMADEDGQTGYPLVDLVSNEGCGIDTGEEQLRDLADEISLALFPKLGDPA